MENHRLPRARHIVAIILLGALGLIGTISYLTWDLKTSSYRSEFWTVQSSEGIVDTLHVVVHPRSMVLPAKVTKTTKPDKVIHYDELYFTYNTPFLIWIALIAVTVACALALSPVILKTIRDIYVMFGQTPKNLLWAVLLTLLIGFLMAFTNSNHYVLMLFSFMDKEHCGILVNHPHWLSALIMIGFLAGLLAMCGQLLINNAIGALPDDLSVADEKKQKKASADFLMLRTWLKFFLSVDAALIVLSLLTTDALRLAIVQEVVVTGTNKDGVFPKEFTYMYGMVFSLYLALLYLPIYYRLRSKGACMVRAVPETDDGKKLIARFLITESPIESFKVAMSILAPVVGALLPGIIKL